MKQKQLPPFLWSMGAVGVLKVIPNLANVVYVTCSLRLHESGGQRQEPRSIKPPAFCLLPSAFRLLQVK